MKEKVMYSLLLVIFLFFHPGGLIAAENNVSTNGQLVDRIMAVVGDEIILLSDVRRKISALMMSRNMNENTPANVIESLFREVIQDMVNEQLLLVKAAQDSIEVDMRQVDLLEKDQLAEIKREYGSDEAFSNALQEFGLTEQQLRYMLREMKYKYLLTETLMQEISSSNTPTSQEMEAWLVANQDSIPVMPEQFQLSHILLYPKVLEKRKDETKEKLQGILKRIRDGEDFAELAREYSQDPGSASEGGDLGFFTRNEMVPEFSEVAFSLQPGEVSNIVETKLQTGEGMQFGFHIIKVEEIRSEQIRARHILMLLKPDEEDEKAIIERLKQMREEIASGNTTFEDMAKENSEDENSSELGGKLQWLTKEQGIPSIIIQAEKLEVGEISEPFKSQFGYHILKLNDYKSAHTLNIKDDNYIIRQMVTQQKNMVELDRILNKLKTETYIDIRME